jgi:uncharacterized protein YegL
LRARGLGSRPTSTEARRQTEGTMLVTRLFAIGSATLLTALAACSGADDGSSLPGSDGDDGTSHGSGNGNGNGSGDGSFDPGGGSQPSDGSFDACATASDEAKLIPVNMYLTVDKSGSMDDNNKWVNARTAFTQFFQDPSADSLNVALRFWPDQGCDDGCNNTPCAQPQVSLGSLKDAAQEQALVGLFNAKQPNGNTPTSAALGGATQWAIEHTNATGGKEKTVVVLLTDGIPTACDENINNIAAIAKYAYDTAGVLTFAVGLQGSQEAQMNIIAQQGGTTKGYFIGNNNAAADLLKALKDIQQSVLACSFQMPVSDDPNMPVNPALINITYVASNGTKTTLKQVADASQCGPDGGWFYDNPQSPQIIELCDASCQLVQGDENGKIEIIVGCSTVTK